MKVYIFQAALLCEPCGADVRNNVAPPQGVDRANPDETLYDSGDWPKGPYENGGGEADTPQHCDYCNCFLENPLTKDGDKYLREAAAPYETPGIDETWDEVAENAGKVSPTVETWIRFYLADGQ